MSRDESISGALFSGIGSWGNMNGSTIGMARTMLVGCTSAAFVGFTTATIGFLAYGTGVLPFMIGSSLGFACAVFGYYHSVLRRALIELRAHPHLMQLHLRYNFPEQTWDEARIARMARVRSLLSAPKIVQGIQQQQQRQEQQQQQQQQQTPGPSTVVTLQSQTQSSPSLPFATWVEDGMLIASWHSAANALEEIHAQKERDIIAKSTPEGDIQAVK